MEMCVRVVVGVSSEMVATHNRDIRLKMFTPPITNHQSTNQPINQSTNQTIKQSNNQTITSACVWYWVSAFDMQWDGMVVSRAAANRSAALGPMCMIASWIRAIDCRRAQMVCAARYLLEREQGILICVEKSLG